MGQNPNIVLVDYLSFMYNPKNQYIGTTYLYRYSTSNEFTEEELNTSMEFVYLPSTVYADRNTRFDEVRFPDDKVGICMYITDDESVAYGRLKELIDHEIPVVAAVDLYYISYHRAFQKEHGIHCDIITGYDEAEGLFELFDVYQHSSSNFDGRLPIREVNQGRSSDNPLSNPIMGDYNRPIRNLWMEVNIGKNFKVTDEGLLAVIKESCLRMRGQKEVSGLPCGFGVLDAFRNSLMEKKAEGPTESNIFYLRSYLNSNLRIVSRSRVRFKVFLNQLGSLLPEDLTATLSAGLDESAKHWDIASNIALKMGIRKSVDLTGDLDKQMQDVKDAESRVVDQMADFLASRGI
jgi:hypothetical protein